MIWTIQLEMVYVLFRFSQTAVKTFNPYKSYVTKPSQQGSNTGLLSASSLLTSLKQCLHHNHPQSNHSLQASSKKAKRGVGEAITTSKSSLFTETAEGEIKSDPFFQGCDLSQWEAEGEGPPSQTLYWEGQIRLPTANSNSPAGIFHPFNTHRSQWLHKTKPQGFNTCPRLKSICKINF